MYRLLMVGLLTVTLAGVLLLKPTGASSTESCLATVAATSTCSFQCIGDFALACGSDPVCHQSNAQFLRALASTPADSPECAVLLANALFLTHMMCGC